MQDKLIELIQTKDASTIAQVGEVILSMGEPWNPGFLSHHRLTSLEGKTYSYESIILIKDADTYILLIPWNLIKYTTFSELQQYAGFYYWINNSPAFGTKAYNPNKPKLGGP